MLDLSMVDVQPEVIRYNLVAEAFRIRCSGCSFDPVQLSSADAGRNCFFVFFKMYIPMYSMYSSRRFEYFELEEVGHF